MGNTTSCRQCQGTGRDWFNLRRYNAPLVAGNLPMAAHRNHVRSRSVAREIHVRLDLPRRLPPRRHHWNKGKSRFRPNTHSRVLDPTEICSRRHYFLDQWDSWSRTLLRCWIRLPAKPWTLCVRPLYRNNPRRHPFRNSTANPGPLMEVPWIRTTIRPLRSQSRLLARGHFVAHMDQHSDTHRIHLRRVANPEILVPLHLPRRTHHGSLPAEQPTRNAQGPYQVLKL